MSDFIKQEDGGYRIYGLDEGANALCFIPSWVTPEQLLAVGADMKPSPKPVSKPKKSKKKPEAVENGGE